MRKKSSLGAKAYVKQTEEKILALQKESFYI